MDNHRIARRTCPINRRDFLKMGGLVGAASLVAGCGGTLKNPSPIPTVKMWSETGSEQSGQSPTPASHPTVSSPAPQAADQARRAATRFAHISDMHIQPGGPGVEGFSRALRDVQSRYPETEFVLNTGDCVMDSLKASKDETRAQWEAFSGVLKAECHLPIHHAIGNHDVWGWGLDADVSQPLRSDPLFGKGFAQQELDIPNRYYSFDLGGWHFVVLDSTHTPEIAGPHPYTGKLDEDQYEWLVQELAATPPSTPVCVVSHIPVLAACEYLDGDNETTGNWVVPGAWVHIDARRLWRLFYEHPNVRLCLSGHTHQVENLQYHGVQYLTNGAISANWWNGPYFDFPPGYVMVTLYSDGSSESEFVAY